MSYPSYLEYFSSRIENVSVATFKIPPTSNNAVSAHQSIQFLLPQNTIVDFRKMRMQFQVTTTGNFSRLPAHASAYFSRISVEVGGQQVAGFENANVLDQILRNNLQIEVDPVNEHAHMSRLTNPVTLQNMAANETYATDDQKAFFSIDLGTLARSIQPSLVSMQYLPQMTITLFLAENAVVSSPSNIDDNTNFVTAHATAATYSIVNHNLFAECFDVADGMLQQVYEQSMMDNGYLELTYENWTSFSDTFNQITRFSSSASSLNKLVATFRRGSAQRPLAGAYNDKNGAVAVVGYNQDVKGAASDNGQVGEGVLAYPETNGAKYQGAFFVGTNPIANASAQDNNALTKDASLEPTLNWSINSVKQPAYNCKLSGWYDLTKSGWGVSRTTSNSLAEWVTNNYSICQKLDLPDSKQLRLMSGLNLKASNANLTLELTGNQSTATTTDNVLIYAANSAILRVGVGKQVQILQ